MYVLYLLQVSKYLYSHCYNVIHVVKLYIVKHQPAIKHYKLARLCLNVQIFEVASP